MPGKFENNKIVLVVGGAGYIGSHMVRLLRESGFKPIVLDNLSSGSEKSVEGVELYKGDAGDKELIKKIHAKHPFYAVMHFAALIQVGESVKNPLKYYENNVTSSISLFKTMDELGVRNVVFSSSAAVYGEPATESKIDERHPKAPINPYGQTKLVVEQLLESWCKSNPEQNAICLRYFNVAGADPTINRGERRSPPTNLIPIVLQKASHGESVTIFGKDYKTEDGTCIRDYIHVKDLCSAHLKALEAIQESRIKGYLPLNLGTGGGHSVLTVIKTVQQVIGREISIEYGARRPGDPCILVADGTRARTVLNWTPCSSNLLTIVKDAWESELKLQMKDLMLSKKITSELVEQKEEKVEKVETQRRSRNSTSTLTRYGFYATLVLTSAYVMHGIATTPKVGK